MEEKTVHAFYTGLIQGVGFRFTARDLANRHKIKGWVKNLSDGRVELMVQAKKSALNKSIFSVLEKITRQKAWACAKSLNFSP